MKQIAQITDIHLDESHPVAHGVDPRRNWEQILSDIAGRGIETIIFTGDIGGSGAYEWFFNTLRPFDFTVIPGNHDTFQEVTKHYNPSYLLGKQEMYHSWEGPIFKYIFLDTSSNELSFEQLRWLEKELASDRQLLLFIHHPVLEVDTAIDKKYPLLNRDQVLMVLEKSGKEVTIFSGHYHTCDVASLGKIRQYVSPAGSVQYEKGTASVRVDNTFFGYRLIVLNDREISTKLVLNKNGQGFQFYPDPLP